MMKKLKLSPNLSSLIIGAILLTACAFPPPPRSTSTQIATPLSAPDLTSTPTPDSNVTSPSTTISTTLQGQPWLWVSFTSPVEQFQIEEPALYQLVFNADGSLNIRADCNRARGSFTSTSDSADGGALTIQIGPSTKAACPPNSRGDQLLSLLGGAARYFFQDGELLIDLMADGGTLHLATATSPEVAAAATLEITTTLSARPWRWTSGVTSVGQVQITNPDAYQLIFAQDGSVSIKADCNNAIGTYTINGENLAIKIGPVTLAACAPDSQSETFLNALGKVAKFTTAESLLILSLADEGGVLLLNAALPTLGDLCGDKALTINSITSTLDTTVTQQLDTMLVALLGSGTRAAPGVSFFVNMPQGRYFKSVGVADVSTCAPLKADSPYQIGSNTKMMTSAMIFQLQEEGTLATTDLLSKWLPELVAKIPNGDQITLDMLLTHTSGIYDYIDGAAGDGPLDELARSRDVLTKAFTPEELVQLAVDYGQPSFPPGTAFKYSNTGYVLLGLVIEKATGQSYEANLKTRIFEPLGLKQTYLLNGQPEPGTLPQGYLAPPFDYTTGEWNTSQGWAAGAVVSTAEDFAVFLKALFTGKLFKQAATLDLMQAHNDLGVNALGPGMTYAHGVTNNNGVLGHGGQTPGFQSDGGYIPSADITFVIWSNSSSNNVNRLVVPEIAEMLAVKP